MLPSLWSKLLRTRVKADAVALEPPGDPPDNRAMTGRHFYFAMLDDSWQPRRILRWQGDWRDIVSRLLDDESSRVCLIQERPQPSGALPHAADIALTRAVIRHLRPLDMQLADHIIQAGSTRFSFRQAGLL